MKEDISKNAKPPLKQIYVVAILLSLTFLSQTGKQEHDYISNIVALVLFSLMAILAEHKGRKPVVTTLFVLSTLSSVAYMKELAPVGHALQTSIRGATIALTGVILCEYSEPKHRIVHLIINSFILRLSYFIYMLYGSKFATEEYFQFFKIVLGLVGLGCMKIWPESPYWLCSKGRFEEAKNAFSNIRSDNQKAAQELDVLTKTQKPGTTKMIIAPLVLGLPVILALSTCLLSAELTVFMSVTASDSTKVLIYLVSNTIITVAYIFAATKLSRRRWLAWTSSITIASNLSLMIFINTVPLSVSYFDYVADILNFISCHLAMGSLATVNYPLAIEMIPCRYSNVISAILGFTYIFGQLFDPWVEEAVLFAALSLLCLVIYPITAYFLLPEAKDKSMVEIEQAFLPKLQNVSSNL